MKKLTYLASLMTILAGAASCQKNIEQPQSQPQPQPSGEFRQVTIEAGTAVSKTSVSGGTLTWSANDKLNIVPQSGSVAAVALDIESGVGESSGTFVGLVDASVTDATNLYGWCGGDWTYSSGAFSVEMPATQTSVANGLAENAYPSIGTGTIKDGITLSNPMGVLILTVKAAMPNDYVKSITITSAANNLAGAFTVTPGDTPTVSGGSSNTLTLNASPSVALSSEGVNFYVVVPPAEYAAGDLSVTVTFSDDSYSVNTFKDAVTVTASNATAIEVSDHTGRRGTLEGQEYVLIRAQYDGTNYSHLKWATQNLAVTESGKAKWNGTNYQIGDYFQWSASYEGYGITAEADKIPTNLVIYESFRNTGKGDTGDSFAWKTGKNSGFAKGIAPYGGSSYSKYTSGPATLALTDDVANIILGGTWKMPTGGSNGQFQKMYDATSWTWNGTDLGYYVTKSGESLASDKSNALLFFPATGQGNGGGLGFQNVGNRVFSWSSTLYSNNTDYSLGLRCTSTAVSPAYKDGRHLGRAVRPVSN